MNAQRTDGPSSWLGSLSDRYRALFTGHNLTVRRSNTVHVVDWATGIGGIAWPVPACRVGVAGWELDALQPTRHDVTCGRCLRQVKRHKTPDLATTEIPGQLALDLIR